LILFLVGLLVIRYLPDPRGRNGKRPPVGSKYK
jgi:hypothetical protein